MGTLYALLLNQAIMLFVVLIVNIVIQKGTIRWCSTNTGEIMMIRELYILAKAQGFYIEPQEGYEDCKNQEAVLCYVCNFSGTISSTVSSSSFCLVRPEITSAIDTCLKFDPEDNI